MRLDITWQCHPSGRGRHRTYWVHVHWTQAGFRWHHQAKIHWEIWHDVIKGDFRAFDDRMEDIIDEIDVSQKGIARKELKKSMQPDPGMNR